MAIEWDSALSVGIAELDEQHRELYAAAAALHDAMRGGRRDALPAILARVRTFAERHFAAEERHMEGLGYPRLGEHRARHRQFVDRFAEFDAAASAGVRPSLLVDVSLFLADWMREHIRGEDGEFGRWASGRLPRAA